MHWTPAHNPAATRANAGARGMWLRPRIRAKVTVDAFGNALGYSLADAASGVSTATMGAGPGPAAEKPTEYTGSGLKVSQGLYDSWGPKINVPDVSVGRPAWDLYADGVPRLSAYQGTYGDEVALSTPVENHWPDVVGRPLADLPPIPRRVVEPNLVQSIVGGSIERLDGIRARLDALGEDPSTPEWMRFGAAAARGPGNWIPEAAKFLVGVGGYGLDSQIRGQVNTTVGKFLSNDPLGTTQAAAVRYWDDHSALEIGSDLFNTVAGGSIGIPLGKATGLAFNGTVSMVGDAGQTAMRWTQKLSDYSLEFPPMKPALYNIVGAVDPRALIPTIRNLRAEAMALAPEGFEVVRISKGAAIMRYADDTYYSVPKGQYSLIPELRTMDTMGDVLTKRVQAIADTFDSSKLTREQSLRLSLTPEGWLKNKFMSAYKGSYAHGGLRDELPFIRGAEDLTYRTTGPDLISSSGAPGLKYEITQLTPSLNAIYSHTKKYPNELLRYVLYR